MGIFTKKRTFVAVGVVLALLIGLAITFALKTWGEINRVSIERPTEVTTPPQDNGGESPESPPSVLEPASTTGIEVYLLVGSDSRADLDDLSGFGAFGGDRADVVMVVIRSGERAAVLSLPRDLWVNDVCTGGQNRINAMLVKCGESLNGPTHLTVTVERLIGEQIDHFAMVDLAGFEKAVDAVGGYEICLQRAVRDAKANLDLPAGCTLADGEQTLAWLRSRRTQELTASGWRLVPGVNDLARNERQRTFLLDMMGKLGDFTSPQSMASTAQSVAPFITVDSELTLMNAVELAWTMRDLDGGDMVQLDIPVIDFMTDNGASVLKASQPVGEIVSEYLSVITAGEELVGASG